MKTLLFSLAMLLASATLSFAQNNARNKGTNFPQERLAMFESHQFHGMPYRLLLPVNYDPEKTYPVILNLHGRAGIGDDNVSQLRPWSKIFATESWRRKYPCIMVAPQSWDSWSIFNEQYPKVSAREIEGLPEYWHARFKENRYPSDYVSTGSLTLAFLLLDQIARDYRVDEDRVYVLGHSMGGFGSWNALWADPDRFAAAIPSAGGLLPWKSVSSFKNVPIWAFHGNADPTVPFEFTKEIFDQLAETKGNMKFTELDGVRHNAVDFGFAYKGDDSDKGWITHHASNRTDKTENVWDWLFKQKR